MANQNKQKQQQQQAGLGESIAHQTQQRKTTGGGAQSEWQVDTQDLRMLLENKLKGQARVEVEYKGWQLQVKQNGEWTEQGVFYAENEEEATQIAKDYGKRQEEFPDDLKVTTTGDTKTRIETKQVRTPLLPDEVVDQILTPIEPIFSKHGYLTKYEDTDIKEELFRHSIATRKRLVAAYTENNNVNPDNFDLVINLVWTMIKLVLKASEGGFTAEGIREKLEERMMTYTDDSEVAKAMSLE